MYSDSTVNYINSINLWLKRHANSSLFDWSIVWLIDWWLDWLIDWLTDWLIDWLIYWLFTDWLIDWLVVCLMAWLMAWLFDWLMAWLIDWLIDRLSTPFIFRFKSRKRWRHPRPRCWFIHGRLLELSKLTRPNNSRQHVG